MRASDESRFSAVPTQHTCREPHAGKVYIVGAGPGHPELLTVKAAQLLKTADVVVYDRLIQEEVLSLTKPSAERIYMGKTVGRHESRQDEIHDLLLKKAGEGKLVVRLKGGDPFLFGRGGEEAEHLAEHGVPFEVVPGVSSALAAPLSAGIAVTHREHASSVAIVTGHEAKKELSGLDWQALSRLETLVFLMGVNNVAVIAQRLMDNGRDPATPAAMIQMAFWHHERVVTATLADIALETSLAGIKPPATLVVGEVVRLREKLKDAQRDLLRRADDSPCFDPAPAPDQLFRLASAGIGSQVLRLALRLEIFDKLDECKSSAEIGRGLGLEPSALDDVLKNLTAMGLLEVVREGYRNLEVASRYLRSDSPQSIKPAILHLSAQSDCWADLTRYVLNGNANLQPNGGGTLFQDACESLARLAAPAVTERLDLSGRGPILLLGWGGDAYRAVLKRRWPEAAFVAANPFLGQPLPQGDQFGVVLLSGLLACCERGEVQRILCMAEAALRQRGLLAFHDSFLPANVLPPPEVALGALGRRIIRGGCGDWSLGRVRDALHALNLENVETMNLLAGTVLVTAEKS